MTAMIAYLLRRDLLRVAETAERSVSSKWRAAKTKRARVLVLREPRGQRPNNSTTVTPPPPPPPPDIPAATELPVRKGLPSSGSRALVEDADDLSNDNDNDRRYSTVAAALASLSLGGELSLFRSHKIDDDCLWCIDTTDLALEHRTPAQYGALRRLGCARRAHRRAQRVRTSPRSLLAAPRCASRCSRPS